MKFGACVQLSLLLAWPALGAADRISLSAAVRAGERAVVTELLGRGADVSATEPDGTTALHWAVYRDDTQTTDLLIAAGADVDAANRNGSTALALACTNASAEMVKRLISAGADVTHAPTGEPPILTCARSGSAEAVGRLLEAGASVDASESWRGQTALMWAAAENHEAVAELLIQRGASVGAATTRGFDALGFATRQGAREAARLLVAAGADIDRAMPSGESLLQIAVRNRHYSIAQDLLANGADFNAADGTGRTALHELVGARAPARRNRAPAATDVLDSLDFMKTLLTAGADPNARTSSSPRLSDAKVGSAVRPIIDNAINTGGATAFWLAARAADVEAMQVLLDGGADPHVPTYGNTSALMVASGLVFLEGSRRFRPQADFLTAVRLTLAQGLDPNTVNEHGQTALHGAVYRASNQIIEALVAAGARTDLADELGRTPLQLAEQGFNQIASVIRRDPAAELLHRLAAPTPAKEPR